MTMGTSTRSGLLLELDAKLQMPPGSKDRFLAEIECHLAEGVEHLVEQGVEPAEAERRVLARFGTAEEIATSFAPRRRWVAWRSWRRFLAWAPDHPWLAALALPAVAYVPFYGGFGLYAAAGGDCRCGTHWPGWLVAPVGAVLLYVAQVALWCLQRSLRGAPSAQSRGGPSGRQRAMALIIGPGYFAAIVLLLAAVREWRLAGALAAPGVLMFGVMRARRGSVARSRFAASVCSPIFVLPLLVSAVVASLAATSLLTAVAALAAVPTSGAVSGVAAWLARERPEGKAPQRIWGWMGESSLRSAGLSGAWGLIVFTSPALAATGTSHLAAALGASAAASGALVAAMALAAPIGRIYARRQRLLAARAAG